MTVRPALILALSFFCTLGFAFPELTRHNYVNCTSCHVSPSGGGLLTAYGRTLSGEVVSTWSREGESDFLWGTIKPPKFLNLGGDLRFAQVHRDNAVAREGKFITMQADLEAALNYEKLSFVGTVGKSDNMKAQNLDEAIVSHRHYLLYQATDQISARFGKFQKAFGLNLPDHVAVTRKGLGWDQNTETYNLELSYLGEQFDVQASGVFGRFDQPSLVRDKGVALKGGYNLDESKKVGVSYFYGDNTKQKRHTFGPYAIIGFTPEFFMLEEFDFQSTKPNNRTSYFGAVSYTKLGYEIYKGLVPYLLHEYGKLNFIDSNSESHGFGLGVQWFPRPHFEVSATFQKLKIRAIDNSYGDYAWLVLHWYP